MIARRLTFGDIWLLLIHSVDDTVLSRGRIYKALSLKSFDIRVNFLLIFIYKMVDIMTMVNLVSQS